MARAVHFIQVGAGNSKIGFTTDDVYSEIGPVLGVSKLGANDNVDQLVEVGQLTKSGAALRLKVRYTVGTEVKRGTVICDIDKAPSAVAGLRGKSFRGGTIASATIPRRRRLG